MRLNRHHLLEFPGSSPESARIHPMLSDDTNVAKATDRLITHHNLKKIDRVFLATLRLPRFLRLAKIKTGERGWVESNSYTQDFRNAGSRISGIFIYPQIIICFPILTASPSPRLHCKIVLSGKLRQSHSSNKREMV